MLFHIAKLAQGTDTFRIKIQPKYHLWEEKTFFLTVCGLYVSMCVYMVFFFFIIVLTKDNHLFTHLHPSLRLWR